MLDKFEKYQKAAILLSKVVEKLRQEGIEDKELFNILHDKMTRYSETALVYFNQNKELIKEIEDYARHIKKRHQQRSESRK